MWYHNIDMDAPARFVRIRLVSSNDREITQMCGLLNMACGGRPANKPQDAVRRLQDYNDYNGRSYGRFQAVLEDKPDSNIIGLTHSAWFEDGVALNSIAIGPERRGEGFGARAIVTLAHLATERALEEIWLYAKPQYDLLKFYQKLGFVALPDSDYRVDTNTISTCWPLVAPVARVAGVSMEPFDYLDNMV